MRALVTESDERLLIEAAQRDPRHFAQLYEDNLDRVYAFIASRVHDRVEAEDLTSEVFHQALAKLDRFEWRGVPFAAWLLRLAANAISDRYSKPSVRFEVAGEEIDPSFDEGTERRALLMQLLDRLPSDQQLVISRRFLDGRSIAEIAGELGRSEGAIKQLQFRALQSLRQQMRSQHV
ncbi:sigma-24, ECF subfamily [Candidatus Koribacter versatilis Ellin345]|uniref:Sigma-24, ECF subfamily n=1 Tax=Koribacter versatilis (strain Ellin345) TaxID=204669 RepID=Q1ILW7_KORVE|nr:sigma-70 family RNA polymerase sigma factor [Candidatus Koribacter versatilis]ABF42133.1 sigma-24, ECF subfamily [Candidatus Koribacter versatilis Ellin345]